eukprot:2502587-Rhodomonas_salina.3
MPQGSCPSRRCEGRGQIRADECDAMHIRVDLYRRARQIQVDQYQYGRENGRRAECAARRPARRIQMQASAFLNGLSVVDEDVECACAWARNRSEINFKPCFVHYSLYQKGACFVFDFAVPCRFFSASNASNRVPGTFGTAK